jgi:hypothetical protein
MSISPASAESLTPVKIETFPDAFAKVDPLAISTLFGSLKEDEAVLTLAYDEPVRETNPPDEASCRSSIPLPATIETDPPIKPLPDDIATDPPVLSPSRLDPPDRDTLPLSPPFESPVDRTSDPDRPSVD